MQKEVPDNNKPKNKSWFIALFVALLAALLLSNLAGEALKNLFMALLGGLTPIIIACIIAFLLLRPLNWMEKVVLRNAFVGNPHAEKYRRWISLVICYLVVIGIIIALIAFLVPSLLSMVNTFADPATFDANMEKIQNGLNALVAQIPWIDDVQTQQAIERGIQSIVDYLETSLPEMLSNLATFLVNTANIIMNTLLGLLISFLMLKDKELISKTFRRYTYAYNKKKTADEIVTVTRRTNVMLNEYVTSTLILMTIIFVIAWLGYAIIGVPYAPLMALILGILSVIPYLGGFIAAVPLVIVSLGFGCSVSTMLVAVLFGILDWAIVTSVVPPFVMSKRMNTRAVVLMIALVIGGAMFGVVGMILSAPIVSVLFIILQERLEVKESQREREELVDLGLATAQEVGTTDILDLRENTAETLFTPAEGQERKYVVKHNFKVKKANIKTNAEKEDKK